jgi:outer membrane protein assembly factor BamD (BamD/ComL family)
MITRILSFLFILFIGLVACQDPKEKLAESIKANEKVLFSDTLRALNDSVALKTLDMYGSFADRYPEDSNASEYLFKSADLALGIQRASMALESLRILIERYPQSDKASSALFMQAFIHETVLKDNEKAKELFLEFIEKYPKHPLFLSAKASYEQLLSGMSDEDLIRMFESKQDSLEKAAG